MTKKLEELFNLPAVEATPEETEQVIADHRDLITDVDQAIDRIDAALPTVRDLETGDQELDELARLAQDKAEDLIDLGMNVEPRFSGVILQTAGVMLGHAITAKTAKLDKKLKMVQLQLAKAKLDYQIKKDAKEPVEAAVEGQGIVLDRNELLKQAGNRLEVIVRQRHGHRRRAVGDIEDRQLAAAADRGRAGQLHLRPVHRLGLGQVVGAGPDRGADVHAAGHFAGDDDRRLPHG
jgi:hypothetical protein